MEFSLQPTATECPICLDTYDDPRILTTCGHSVCAGCVQKVLDSQNKNGKSKKISCPECETDSTVPATGLPKNYRLAGVISEAKARSNCGGCRQKVLQSDLFRCDTCPKAGDKEMLLCAKCVVKSHRAHDVVEFDKASKKDIEDILQELGRTPNRSLMSIGHSDINELGEHIRQAVWSYKTCLEKRDALKTALATSEDLTRKQLREGATVGESLQRTIDDTEKALVSLSRLHGVFKNAADNTSKVLRPVTDLLKNLKALRNVEANAAEPSASTKETHGTSKRKLSAPSGTARSEPLKKEPKH